MTEQASLKARMTAGETVIGTWLNIPHPIAIEAMAGPDFDFIQIDGEHGPIHPDLLHELLPAARAAGMSAVYRARRNRDDLVSAALDQGVEAVMVPMVNTAEAARAAVAAAKYPPLGRRGFGPWRATNYYRAAEGYPREANRDILVSVQIEHVEALANLDAIAAVEGLDLLYVGPADLALSLGLEVGARDPRMDDAYARVADAAARNGKLAGSDVVSLDGVRGLAALGYRFFTYGGDLAYLTAGIAAAGSELRRALKSKA